MYGIVSAILRQTMRSGDLDTAEAELAALRSIVDKHHKISRARYRQIRDEVDGLTGDRATAIAAYQRSFGINTGEIAQAYWVDNEDVLEAANRAVDSLRAGQGNWRPAKDGGLVFTDRSTLAAWMRASDDLDEAGKRLKGNAFIVHNPDAMDVGSATPP